MYGTINSMQAAKQWENKDKGPDQTKWEIHFLCVCVIQLQNGRPARLQPNKLSSIGKRMQDMNRLLYSIIALSRNRYALIYMFP